MLETKFLDNLPSPSSDGAPLSARVHGLSVQIHRQRSPRVPGHPNRTAASVIKNAGRNGIRWPNRHVTTTELRSPQADKAWSFKRLDLSIARAKQIFPLLLTSQRCSPKLRYSCHCSLYICSASIRHLLFLPGFSETPSPVARKTVSTHLHCFPVEVWLVNLQNRLLAMASSRVRSMPLPLNPCTKRRVW